MGRIIGIDFGTKRIGLAVTDPQRIFAFPLVTIPANEFETFIKDYIAKEPVDEFVIGYPTQMNNTPSETVKYLKPFIGKIKKTFPEISVNLIDERFTSGMAFDIILEGGVKKKDRMNKMLVDKISASIILQTFLDKRANKK